MGKQTLYISDIGRICIECNVCEISIAIPIDTDIEEDQFKAVAKCACNNDEEIYHDLYELLFVLKKINSKRTNSLTHGNGKMICLEGSE